MIVEDNADFAELLEQLLAEWGHTTEIATDGDSALAKAIAFRPEIAFIDIGLPGRTGFEVAADLRAHLGPTAKLVAVSGYGEREHRQRADDAGFDRFLQKPLLEERLAAVLATFRDAEDRP